jgi:alkylation response protein AidB-like acyl-CoA dehydrogenase
MPEYGLQILSRIAKACGVEDDPTFRDRFAGLQIDVRHLGDIYHHFAARIHKGEALGQDVSMLKIVATELFQKIADLIVETAGPLAGLAGDTIIGDDTINIMAPFYKARPASIYGGTNEIQRNIIAREILELPSR